MESESGIWTPYDTDILTPEEIAELLDFDGSMEGIREFINERNSEEHANRSAGGKRRWANPAYRAKVIIEILKVNSKPALRSRRKMAASRNWIDPEYRNAVLSKLLSIRDEISEKSRARWTDPEYRSRHTSAVRASCCTPEFADKMRRIANNRWSDPEYNRTIDLESRHARPPSRVNKSGFKGVSWSNQNKKWRASIQHNGRLEQTYWTNILDAVRAYNTAALKFFGPSAYQNSIPEEVELSVTGESSRYTQ